MNVSLRYRQTSLKRKDSQQQQKHHVRRLFLNKNNHFIAIKQCELCQKSKLVKLLTMYTIGTGEPRLYMHNDPWRQPTKRRWGYPVLISSAWATSAQLLGQGLGNCQTALLAESASVRTLQHSRKSYKVGTQYNMMETQAFVFFMFSVSSLCIQQNILYIMNIPKRLRTLRDGQLHRFI